MKITLNGDEHEVSGGTTVAALLADVVGTARGSAVAVDGAVIPRAEWPVLVLRDGQQVELVTAVPGG